MKQGDGKSTSTSAQRLPGGNESLFEISSSDFGKKLYASLKKD